MSEESKTAAPGPAEKWWAQYCAQDGGNAGVRARLRRCHEQIDAFAIPAAHELAHRLGGKDDVDMKFRTAVDLARVLAHIKEDGRAHPMRAAGWSSLPTTNSDPNDRPKLAEARFKRLMQVTEGEEKVMAFIRLIHLLNGQARVRDIADAFIWWNHPSGRTRRAWAYEYYNAGRYSPETSESNSGEETIAS